MVMAIFNAVRQLSVFLVFGFPDMDTNDEHVRPKAARAYRRAHGVL